RPL
ncbi:hypothetical protein BN1708_018706, partial [Verticillium longisporum]